MAAPSPSLSLSDIMHPLSPPPMSAMQKLSPPSRARSSTPEPLEPNEIEEMRRRVLSMGWGNLEKGKEKAGSVEQELADMLLRITHPASLPQASQLHAQAETIAHLIQQRDFLAERSVEDRERWESEREGWARAAQALIIQGRRGLAKAEKEDSIAAQYAAVTTDGASHRLQDFERANVTLQNEKKLLQKKLVDTQRRLASIESELAHLKPLLLMQPFALTHSHPTDTPHGWSAILKSPSTPVSSQRGRGGLDHPADTDIIGDTEEDSDDPQRTPRRTGPAQSRPPPLRPISLAHSHSHEQPPSFKPSSPPTSPPKAKASYYRRRESLVDTPHAQDTKSGRRAKGTAIGGGSGVATTHERGSSKPPTLSDARAEHLLLAARKIGRQRAAVLSRAFGHAPHMLGTEQPQHERRHQHLQEQAPPAATSLSRQKAAPSSPSKTQQQHATTPRTPRRGHAGNTVAAPLLTRIPLGQSHRSQGQTQTGATCATQRTPLQSLLSAAQSVLSAPSGEGGDGSSPASSSTAAAAVAAMLMPESPLAKRRKLEHGYGREDRRGEGRERRVLRTGNGMDGGDGNVTGMDEWRGENVTKVPEMEQETEEGGKETAPFPGVVARVKSALDFLADQAEVYSTGSQSVGQEKEAESRKRKRSGSNDEGEDKGEDEGGANPVETAGTQEGPDVNLKDMASAEADDGEPQTQTQSQSLPLQGSFDRTPSASLGTFSNLSASAASFGFEDQTQTHLEHQSMSKPLMTLAPPIDLTPRASRSPAPYSLQPPSQPPLLPPRRPSPQPRTSQHSPDSQQPPFEPDPFERTKKATQNQKARAPSTGRGRPGLLARALSAPAVGGVRAADAAPLLRSASLDSAPLGSLFSMFSVQPTQSVLPTSASATLRTMAPPPVAAADRAGGGGEKFEQHMRVPLPAGGVAPAPAKVEGIKFVSFDGAPRKTRSSYVKWTKEEDELLAKAVAKHGQKWDSVQAALPSRGYHQVRQRWLRKLAVFDDIKHDLSSLESNPTAEFFTISMVSSPPSAVVAGQNDNEVHHLFPLSPAEETRPGLRTDLKSGFTPLNKDRNLAASSTRGNDLIG